MEYIDFLNTFTDPIKAFLRWATTITYALINNYVFITAIGISVITSLLYLFFDHFLTLGDRSPKKRNLDNGGKK